MTVFHFSLYSSNVADKLNSKRNYPASFHKGFQGEPQFSGVGWFLPIVNNYEMFLVDLNVLNKHALSQWRWQTRLDLSRREEPLISCLALSNLMQHDFFGLAGNKP